MFSLILQKPLSLKQACKASSELILYTFLFTLTNMLFTLQSTPSPNVEAQNAKGQSIQDLAAAAMSHGSDASSDDEPLAQQSPPAKRARLHHASTGSGLRPSDELDNESEWQARLREESGAELRGGDEEDWDRYTQACILAWCLLQDCRACPGPHSESAGCLIYL